MSSSNNPPHLHSRIPDPTDYDVPVMLWRDLHRHSHPLSPQTATALANTRLAEMHKYLERFGGRTGKPEPYYSLSIRRSLAVYIMPFVPKNHPNYKIWTRNLPLPTHPESYIFKLGDYVVNHGLHEYQLIPDHGLLWNDTPFRPPPRIQGPQSWSGQGDIYSEVSQQLQRVLTAKAQLLHEEILLFRLREQFMTSYPPSSAIDESMAETLGAYCREFELRNFALVNVQQSDQNAPAINYTLNSQVHFLPARCFECHPAVHDHFRERGHSVYGQAYS